ncbi:MAG TPA: FAD-dependent oxidoreductase [Solirubrobacteraceae bacterium]|jgi:NADPH-dependent 2,4-dienoyl-CoA reductase/sulfur reductase-like enzyme
MSDRFEFVAVGGGPAAFAAVRAFRDAGGTGDVALVTDESRVPYERPPLTKELLRGEIDEAETALEDEFWFWREGVSLICGRAMRLDPEASEVALAGGRTLQYAKCVIATGSEPTRLPVPGADDPAVRVVRSLDDLHQLNDHLDAGAAVAVVGSGFIGCEIAVSLRLRGHPVSLVSDEPAPNQRRLGQHAAWVIETWLRDSGVAVTLDATVSAIERRDGELQVVSDRGRLGAPVVVFATGVAPRSQLLTGRELLSDGGRIAVDSSMRTQVPGLFAAGDVALAHNDACGRPLPVEHWGDALGQGQVAGTVAAGRSATWDDVPGFWSTIGDHTLKYAAWGDGYDDSRVERPDQDDAFTVWYGRENAIVGVLTHNADEHYERGRELIKEGAPWQTR